MENKFKLLNEQKKKNSAASTFDEAIFHDSSWGIDILFEVPTTERTAESSLPTKNEAPAPSFKEAVRELGAMVENADAPIIRDNLKLTSENWSSLTIPEIAFQEPYQISTDVLFIGVAKENLEVSSKQSEIIVNMARAMKLAENEYKIIAVSEKYLERDDLHLVSFFEDSNEYEFQEILSEIVKFRPKIVFSLGASITNGLLRRKEKLSAMHGNLLELRLSSENNSQLFLTKLMPLFHPDLLIINPNMKRTTWIDLQKAMNFLGKI